MYLAFNGFTSQIPFFYGRAAFCRTWLEGTCYLLSKDSASFFPPERAGNRLLYLPISVSKLNSFCGQGTWNLATVSTHLITPTAVQEVHSFRGRDLGVWLQFSTSLHTDCCPRTEKPYPYFLWRKGYYFQRKGFGQSFGSFLLLLLLIQSCYSMTYIPSPSTRLWSVGSLTLFWLGFVTLFNRLAARNWPLFISLF